jgi:RNA polymerase sigma factor (TIGR02999 family)
MSRRGFETLLPDVRAGKPEAVKELVGLVYPELRRLAARQLRRERLGHTLQPTALVHESFVRLFGSNPIQWRDRMHFFATAARQMRRILTDYARWRGRRGGNLKVSLTEAEGLTDSRIEDVLAVDEALTKLELLDTRSAQVVELRFFAGLQIEEVAEVLGIANVTVRRDWEFAKAWLLDQLSVAKSSPE